MTNNAREQIAALIEGQFPDGVAVLSPDDVAQMIAAALPSILAGVIKPLEWLGGGNRYHTRCGNFASEFVCNQRRSGWNLLQADFGDQHRGYFGGNEGLQEAMGEAEKIHIATILSAIGVET